MRIADLKARSQESGARIQNKRSKSEYLFSTDYWLLSFASNLKRSAPPTSNFLPYALCSMLYALLNLKSSIYNLKSPDLVIDRESFTLIFFAIL